MRGSNGGCGFLGSHILRHVRQLASSISDWTRGRYVKRSCGRGTNRPRENSRSKGLIVQWARADAWRLSTLGPLPRPGRAHPIAAVVIELAYEQRIGRLAGSVGPRSAEMIPQASLGLLPQLLGHDRRVL